MKTFKNAFMPVRQIGAALAILALVLMQFALFIPKAEAAVGASLNQAENGGVGNTPINPVDWVNGNVNQTKGHYTEGDSIPYRVIAEGLTIGTPSTLVIGFDVTKGGKFAIDYITSNDRIAETVNPCSNIPTICSGSPNTAPIPAPGYSGSVNGFSAADVLASFNALVGAEGQQVMKIWNGTISSVTYSTQADLTDADAKAEVTIVFTPTSDKAVISWGGHISESLDYPGGSAVNISGSPYHSNIVSIDGKGGKEDAALSASAVAYPGNLIVVKHVVNNGGGSKTADDFTINITASDTAVPVQFAGSEDGTGVTIDVPQNGTTNYTVTEVEDPDYTATYEGDCTNIDIAALQQKVCTITNTYVPPAATLTLVKNVVNTEDGDAMATDWTLTATGPETISGAGGAAATIVVPGTYTLTESAGPARYTPSAWVCTGKTVTNNQVELVNGDNVTCTITNTYVPPLKASITVVKTVADLFNGGATTASFDYFVTSASQAVTEVFHNIAALFDAGTYTVSETTLLGYTAGDWGGDCVGGTVTVAEGGSATCTITNTAVAPSITIKKVVDNGTSETLKSPDDFSIVLTAADINGVEADDEKTFAGSLSGTTFTFDAGSYAVTEPSHAGYTMELTGDCAGTAALGAELECTVTNTYIEPTVTTVNFTKVVDNQFGGTAVSSDFSLHIVGTNVDVTVPHGSSTQLPLGSYTVTETGPTTGYGADYSGFCEGAVMTVAPGDLGKARTCTVTNHDIQPELTVIKHVVNDNDTETDVDLLADAFMLGVTGTDVSAPSFAGSETGTVVKLDAGAFTVTEEQEAGYSATFSGDCALDGTGSIGVGEKKTCTITNDDIPPTEAIITVTKELPPVPDYSLPNGTFEDFSFVMQGYNNNQPTAFEADGTNQITVTTGGNHIVAEVLKPGYVTSYSQSCDALSSVVLGWSYSCVITNTELPQCSDGIDNNDSEDTLVDSEDPGCIDEDDDDETDPTTSITINKEVTGENANTQTPFDFDYSWTGTGLDVSLAADSAPVTAVVRPGEGLVVTENLIGMDGWTIENAVCTSENGTVPENDLDQNPNSVTLNLSLGEQITCVFTNHFTPRDSGNNDENIIVKKEVTEGSDTGTFFGFDVSWLDIEGPSDFVLAAGGLPKDSLDLAADEIYSVTELPKDGWTLESVTCTSNLELPPETTIDPTAIHLRDGETVTCTFLNDQELFELYGFVWNDVDEDGIFDVGESPLSGWAVGTTNGSKSYSTVSGSDGRYSFMVPAGTWTINETLQSGWNQTFPSVENERVHVVTVPQFEEPQLEIFSSIMNFFIPTAFAQTPSYATVYGAYNFGNTQIPVPTPTGGGGGNGKKVEMSNRGNNDDDGEVLGASTSRAPAGEVLGESVIMPVGAPNTGAGGASPSTTLPSHIALLGIVFSLVIIRATRNG